MYMLSSFNKERYIFITETEVKHQTTLTHCSPHRQSCYQCFILGKPMSKYSVFNYIEYTIIKELSISVLFHICLVQKTLCHGDGIS